MDKSFSRLELKYLAELIVFQTETQVKDTGPIEYRQAILDQLLECSSSELSDIARLFNGDTPVVHPSGTLPRDLI